MKIKILLILSLVSANILADEYTGTISIAKHHRFIKPWKLFYRDGEGLYLMSSIIHHSGDYPKYGHAYLENDFVVPADDVELENKDHNRLVEKYHVMPHYMQGLDISDEIYLMVKITLQEHSFFQSITYCWLPLNLFFKDDGFKTAGEKITLYQTFTDYKGEQENSTFKLTLDNTFNDIEWHYQEFLEDYQKPCHTQAKNCLIRAIKKLKKKLGYQ